MSMIPSLKTAKVHQSKYLNPKTLFIDFMMESGLPLNFRPGQFISLKVAETAFRSYSICSDPGFSQMVSLVATVDHQGLGAAYLKSLKIGDQVTFVGPAGRFTLSPTLPFKIVFVATGTGIAPFISMLYKLALNAADIEIKLYFGVRYETDIFFKDQLDSFKVLLKNFSYTITISKPTLAWTGAKGRVTDLISSEFTQNMTGTHMYICGNPFMVEDMKKLCADNLVPLENIFFEKFTVSVPPVSVIS